MKKAQFISPIILALIFVSYFIISSGIGEMHSRLISSRAGMLKLSNEINEIEKMDLQWQANLSHKALLMLNSINSSGTINGLLAEYDAKIFELESNYGDINITGLNYTKEYIIEGPQKNISKTISGTMIVPYPYYFFSEEVEPSFRNCIESSEPDLWELCILKIGYDFPNTYAIKDNDAYLHGIKIVHVNHSDFPLTSIYYYIINLD